MTLTFSLLLYQIDVQVATYHLVDHIEWDLFSPLTPETFAITLCADLGLAGEAVPLIAHAIHEELIKHKRDAIEWGVIGSSTDAVEYTNPADKEKMRDKSGLSLLKDKTGLGLGLGRTPKEGRGPRTLKSVWKDWLEAAEYRTRFEVLSAEEVERREVERERATRYVSFCFALLTFSWIILTTPFPYPFQPFAKRDVKIPESSYSTTKEMIHIETLSSFQTIPLSCCRSLLLRCFVYIICCRGRRLVTAFVMVHDMNF